MSKRDIRTGPSKSAAGNKSPAAGGTVMLAAVLGLLTFALYAPVLHHGFVAFDDAAYVTANARVQAGLTPGNIPWAFTSLVSANWHPLTVLSHMLDCQWYGLRPWGHHLTSVLLHALNTVLVFLLLLRLTGARWRSVMVAALFGWHPLHVESVAWVAERKDVLSTGFGLLALLLYARFARDAGAGAREPGDKPDGVLRRVPGSRFYWLAWLCFVLGLLSKPMLVTWPFVMLLLDYWPLKRLWRGRVWPLVAEKIPFFAVAAAVSVVTFLAQRDAGAMVPLTAASPALRCENAPVAYVTYLAKLFWPAHLAVFYPFPTSLSVAEAVLAGVALGAISALVWLKRMRHPYLPVGWFWFLGTLVPVIGLVQVGGQGVADRYTYIPSVGVFILVVWGAHEFSRDWRRQTQVLAGAGLAALILCCAASWRQVGYWQNTETLFRHALTVTADNFTARNNLGLGLLEERQTNAAIHELQAAVRFHAASSEAHNNLAIIEAAVGRNAEAITEFQQALQARPDYADAHFNYAALLAGIGQTNQAIAEYQQALRLEPDDAEAGYKLANLLARKGLTNEAIGRFQETLRRQPDYAEARNNLGSLLIAAGRTNEGVRQFQTALRTKPDYADAHFNLGNAFLRSGQIDDAIAQYRAVTILQSNSVPAHYYLGVALARKNDAAGAIAELEMALRLKPDYAMAHNRLGLLLGRQGRLDEAISHFRQAVRLKPDYAEANNNLARALAAAGGGDEAGP
jgi:tetratricopeptide (TPR) repeat protein